MTGYRGNATTSRSWTDIAANQYVETHAQYDNFGNLRNAWDAKGNLTQTDYSSAYQYAYPTSVTSAIPDPTGVNGSNTAFTTSTTYDTTTGLPLTSTDANGQTSTMEYNDPLLRPTKVTAPNGQQTITEYGAGTDSTNRYVKVSTQIDATNWKVGYSSYDGLGRTIKTQSVDSAGDVFVDTEYDNMGRVKRSTNPYRTGDTIYWTTNTFDDLGRVTAVTTPDSAVVSTAYSLATTGSQIGTVVTVTNQAGKQRRSVTNALGQLTRVDEPNDTGALGNIDTPTQPTYYSYDTLNNLTTVTQGAQTRTFTYNSLSRLLSATNPELGSTPTNGTINYQYDPNGNLTQKTDPRGISTNYAYDALNRVKTRTYSDATPTVTYTYDNLTNAKGKLTKVSSSVSTTEYTSFDIMGRVTGHKQTTDGTAYTTGYTYNLSGTLLEETYPSGRKVRNTLNTNGDLSLVETQPSGGSYATRANNFTYTAAGAVGLMQLGNGLWESTQFNSRLQPTQIALGTTQNGTDQLKLNYAYGTAANNGNVQSQTITVPTVGANPGFTATQNYTYDSLNRLKMAAETVAASAGRTNVALASNGGTASASSEYGTGTFPASGANDGDRKGLNWNAGAGWNDNTSDSYPDWLQTDFSGSKTISEIDVFTLQDNYSNPVEPTESTTFTQYGITSFDVQYWNGSAWTTVPNGSITNNNKVWTKVTFPAVSTTKIRVVVNASLSSYSRIVELEAWSDPPANAGWQQAFNYDRYGNRNFDVLNTTTLGSCSQAQCDPTVNAANNRFTSGQGYTYDLAGNVITDAEGRTFTFDAENKQTLVKDINNAVVGTYYYDGDGKRVKKAATTETITFVYDAAGKLIEEYSGSTLQTAYVYIGSRLLTTETSTGTNYLTSDHLGSPRINTDGSGNVSARHDYMPFGEEIFTVGGRIAGLGYGSDTVRKKFISYERDNESGLDFAEARYHNSSVGRFQSPDPLMASARRANPQTFNRYNYAVNNPINLTDPFGLAACPPGRSCYRNDGDASYVERYIGDDGEEVITGEPGNTPAQTRLVSTVNTVIDTRPVDIADPRTVRSGVEYASDLEAGDGPIGGEPGSIGEGQRPPLWRWMVDYQTGDNMYENEDLFLRTMKIGDDDLPVEGQSATTLGAREPDIPIGEGGTVEPETGGMSVTPEGGTLPDFSGNNLRIWCISCEELGPNLRFTPDLNNPLNHGFIKPNETMTFHEYQQFLRDTRPFWRPYSPR